MVEREKEQPALPDLSPNSAAALVPHNQTPLPSYATLVAGCAFVSRHPVMIATGAHSRATAQAAVVRRRVMANRIRELDRFLAVLLNEAAGQIDGAGHDAERFDRISNTSKKLLAVEALAGMALADHCRLRAMGRIAARLRGASHHCRAASLLVDLDIASGEAGLRSAAGCGAIIASSHGKAVIPLMLNFVTISTFYQDIGQRIVKDVAQTNYSP